MAAAYVKKIIIRGHHVYSIQTVFLIDHLWCTTSWGAREQLKAHPMVRQNMHYVLGLGKSNSLAIA